MMEAPPYPRREFLKKSGAALLLASGRMLGATEPLSNPVGYATISWPEKQFEHALETISALGFQGVQVLGWLREKYRTRSEFLHERLQKLKLQPVALSCWKVALKPDAPGDDLEQLRSYAQFFQHLGGLYVQVTDGGKPGERYSAGTMRKLGAQLDEMGRIAQDHALTLGYHPHTGSIGETEEGTARILEATDPGLVKLIADVGHLTLGGMDPARFIRSYEERLILTHFKDVRPDAAEVARANRRALRGRKHVFCEIGRGVVDFAAVAAAYRDIQHKGWVIVELDGNEPAPGGPDASARTNRDAMQKLGFIV
jgi:inosose dehydratase